MTAKLFRTLLRSFATGYLQGALLMALALVLCGVIGRELHARPADDGATLRDFAANVVLETKIRDWRRTRDAVPTIRAPKGSSRAGKAFPRASRRDPAISGARRWARCSGAACYHDVRGTAAGYLPAAGTVDVNEGL